VAVNAWHVVSQSHCGNVRKINEDAVLALTQPLLLAIADGMGGHQAGDIASNMLITNLSRVNRKIDLTNNVSLVKEAIMASNESILAYSKDHLNGQTVGTTIVTMLSNCTHASCLWAGDSRLYRLRNNHLEQLTQDHSYVAELIKTGQLQAKDAYQHPSSNIITRSVGVETSLSLEQINFDILAQDTFLLCSDGLYDETKESELLQAMQVNDIYRGSNWLLNLSLGRTAKDNVSFIIARALDDHQTDQDSTTLTNFSV